MLIFLLANSLIYLKISINSGFVSKQPKTLNVVWHVRTGDITLYNNEVIYYDTLLQTLLDSTEMKRKDIGHSLQLVTLILSLVVECVIIIYLYRYLKAKKSSHILRVSSLPQNSISARVYSAAFVPF